MAYGLKASSCDPLTEFEMIAQFSMFHELKKNTNGIMVTKVTML